MHLSAKCPQLKFKVLVVSVKKKKKIVITNEEEEKGYWEQAVVSATGYYVIWFRFKGRRIADQTLRGPSGPMRIWKFCDSLYSSVINSSLEET